MLRSSGLPELLVLIVVAFLIVPFWKIFSKAGYPGIIGVLMLVPFLNLVLLFFLGFSDWQVLKELNALRQEPTPT